MSDDKPNLEELENESLFTAKNREKKALVSLGGFATTESGKLTKSNYFRFLDHNLDDYSDIQLTETEARKIHTHLRKLSTGATAMVPMYCAGPQCPFADRCPLQQMGKAPIGRQCLIEVQLAKEWIMRYFEEYEVDPDNFTEVGYVNELAELQILEMRINMNLARPQYAELIMDQVVSVSNDGTPIVQKQISPFMDQKERIAARRSKIIKLMVGDRQEKYKKEAALKVRMDADPSSKMASMRSRLESLQKQLEKMSTPESIEESNQEGFLSPDDIISASDD